MRALKIAPYQVARPARRTKTAPGRIHFTRVEFPLEQAIATLGDLDEQDRPFAERSLEQPAAR